MVYEYSPIMFLHAPTVIRIRRLLYAIILGRKYSIRSGTNNIMVCYAEPVVVNHGVLF
jgi:hypothetical protein